MENFITKIDNDETGAGEVVAREYNSIFSENKNAVSAFMSLNSADAKQLLKSIDIASKAMFYTDSGTVNNIQLTRGATSEAIETLFDGMMIVFTPANENTGATTLKVKELTAKELKYNGVGVSAGFLKTDSKYIAIYSKTNDCFDVDLLVNYKNLQDAIDSLITEEKNSFKHRKPMVAFIFDDAYMSHWDNAYLFEDRGVRCGFAVNKTYTNITNRMTFSQLKDLQARGFEIINHSFSHIPQTGTVWEQSLQEIEQNYELLDFEGLDIKGFVTPNSQLSDKDRIEILKRHHSYAFTEYKGGAVGADAVYSETDTTTIFDLFRPECTSYANTIATLDVIKDTNGLTVFYSHDIDGTGVSVANLTAYIDYAQANGIEIVTPRALTEELARRKAQTYYEPIDVFVKDNIYSGHFGMSNSASVDAVLVTDGDKNTITVTAGANVGDLVFSNMYGDKIASAVNQEFVFQFDINSTVSNDTGLTIGIRVQRASDNVVLYDNESLAVKIDGNTRKYRISTGNITVNEQFYFNLFYRIKGVGATDMVIVQDNPILHQGSIADIVEIDRDYSIAQTSEMRIPFDTTTVASSTRTAVNMVVSENSLINIEATKITFKKSGFYSVNARCRCLLDADHTGARTISRFLINNAGRVQSDVTAIADRANFNNSIVNYFDVGDTLLLDVWHDTGVDQTVGNEPDYNLLDIVKIN